VQHSEFNNSRTEGAHFLQIWIMPARPAASPATSRKAFADEEKARSPAPDRQPGRARGLGAHSPGGFRVRRTLRRRGIARAPIRRRTPGVRARGERRDRGQRQRLSAGDALLFEAEEWCASPMAADAEILVFDLPR
jgi:hypothetical protein